MLDASRKKSYEDKKFMAAIQGVELEDEQESKEDILDLKGLSARNDGFGIDHGLGAMTMGEDE